MNFSFSKDLVTKVTCVKCLHDNDNIYDIKQTVCLSVLGSSMHPTELRTRQWRQADGWTRTSYCHLQPGLCLPVEPPRQPCHGKPVPWHHHQSSSVCQSVNIICIKKQFYNCVLLCFILVDKDKEKKHKREWKRFHNRRTKVKFLSKVNIVERKSSHSNSKLHFLVLKIEDKVFHFILKKFLKEWFFCLSFSLTLSQMESKIEHYGLGGGRLITPAISTTQDFA